MGNRDMTTYDNKMQINRSSWRLFRSAILSSPQYAQMYANLSFYTAFSKQV